MPPGGTSDTTAQSQFPRTRRHLLRIGSGAAVYGFAGCLGDDDDAGDDGDGTADGDGDGSGELVDDTFVTWARGVPEEMQYNVYNPTQFPIRSRNYIWDNTAILDLDLEIKPIPEYDVTVEDEMVQIGLDDRLWHNGDEYLANDVIINYKLDRFTGENKWPQITELERVDDKTVNVHLDPDVRFDVFMFDFFLPDGSRIYTNRSLYADYVERIEEVLSFDEAIDMQISDYPDQAQTAIEDLTTWAPEEPVGNGLWKLTDATETRYFLEKHEDHPMADELNFDKHEIVWAEEAARLRQFEEGVFDFLDPQEQAIMPEQPEGYEMYQWLRSGGLGWHSQMRPDRSKVDNRHVRRAILYLLPYEQLGQVMGDSFTTLQGTTIVGWSWVTDLSAYMADEHLQRIDDEFDDYGVQPQEDKATAELEAAGWTKDGETWLNANGEEAAIPLSSPPGGVRFAMSEPLPSIFEQFGIASEHNARGDHFDIAVPGEYDGLAAWTYSHRNAWHPAVDLDLNLRNYGESYGAGDSLVAPETIGDPSSPDREWDIAERLDKLLQNLPDEEYSQVLFELAWIYNQNPTIIPAGTQFSTFFLNRGDWEFQMEELKKLIRPSHEVLSRGLVQGKPR